MTIILDPFEHLKREGSLEDFEGQWLVISIKSATKKHASRCYRSKLRETCFSVAFDGFDPIIRWTGISKYCNTNMRDK